MNIHMLMHRLQLNADAVLFVLARSLAVELFAAVATGTYGMFEFASLLLLLCTYYCRCCCCNWDGGATAVHTDYERMNVGPHNIRHLDRSKIEPYDAANRDSAVSTIIQWGRLRRSCW